MKHDRLSMTRLLRNCRLVLFFTVCPPSSHFIASTITDTIDNKVASSLNGRGFHIHTGKQTVAINKLYDIPTPKRPLFLRHFNNPCAASESILQADLISDHSKELF